MRNANVSGGTRPINSAQVKFNGSGDVVHAQHAGRDLSAGNAIGNLTYYPKQQATTRA